MKLFELFEKKDKLSLPDIEVGDEVKVEMTPYDLTKGRITLRY